MCLEVRNKTMCITKKSYFFNSFCVKHDHTVCWSPTLKIARKYANFQLQSDWILSHKLVSISFSPGKYFLKCIYLKVYQI